MVVSRATTPAMKKLREPGPLLGTTEMGEQQDEAAINGGPDAHLEGDMIEEEEDDVEFEIDDAEVALARQWTVLVRFYSL